ncbi:MAG: glycosyltransferase family 2 protein [Proteobacteria bacterium]|nr:glycosyltransferase family 2 protein [Pseudomonadota bacterium]MBU4573641.1 glycosyltransferase family 2 protein [Pseudomonadota bacterium]MBU4599643.1 glycosyltransferase family 2 protein [Pseudomonadota bacterium]MBV1716139.1 glycosyltransferase family 2 protein [Desulfarculus sp.]MBV1753185.1 glycosyltransferase family 2 protein [Desulfarculus sp.]
MIKLSAAVIVQNEEKNLPRWLKAVSQVADEIVAVDSGSSDRSVEILRQAGAKVEFRAWTGYADQRNAAAGLCTGDWILMLDADEVLAPESIASLRGFKQGPEPEHDILLMPSRVWFFGHFMRHGGFFPEWKPRLYRRGAARWVRQQVHERLEARGSTGRLPGLYDHYSYDTVEDYRSRARGYAEAGARFMLAAGKRCGSLTGPTHAAWAFVHRYLVRLGFMDGKAGWWAAWLEGVYTLEKYRCLAEMIRDGKSGRVA